MNTAKERDLTRKYLRPLVGATVIEVDADCDGFPCLVVRLSSGRTIVAYVQCDPEGNGPGFLALNYRS